MANPNGNLATLGPPFQKGEVHNPAGRPKNVPLITPRMRHYAELSYLQLLALADNQQKLDTLPAKDVIAITMLVKAMKDVQWGDKAREDVVRRLDGREPDVQVSVNVAVGIDLTWHDGEEA